jgi:hypothetical protein
MIYYGEIICSYPPSDTRNKYKLRQEYSVKLLMDSSAPIISNVVMLSDNEGVDDFTEVVLRGSRDDGGRGGYLAATIEEDSLMAGVRVVVGFPGGSGQENLYCGFILGCLPHISNVISQNPSKLNTLPAIIQANAKPQFRKKMNGILHSIDSLGQLRFQYNGIAKINPNKDPLREIPQVSSVGNMTMDFLQKSVFRLVDNNHQAVVVDSFGQFVSVNNTTEPPKPTYGSEEKLVINEVSGLSKPIGQEVRLDKSSSTLFLRSSDKIVAVCNDETMKNESLLVDSKNITMKDNNGSTVSITGGNITTESNNLTQKASSITLKDTAAASLKIAGGKVSLGTGAAEVITLAIQTIDDILTSTPLAISAVGPCQASPALIASLTVTKTLLSTIKF